MKAIVWQVTRRCNFSCPYCAIYVRPGEEGYSEEHDYMKWLEVFNRLRPDTLDITGGEPFLFKGLVDLIEGLDPAIRLGMTTNLTKSMMDFVSRIQPGRFVNITASYHPTQKISKDEFFGKVMLLKNKGFPICINFVAYPEQMYLASGIEETVKGIGVRFHVDPYDQAGDVPKYKFDYQERQFLSQHVKGDRAFRLYPEDKDVLCSGGNDYLMILPDGTANRCMHYNLAKREPMGNVFSPDFKLNAGLTPCNIPSRCSGCDKDKVTING